MNREDFPAFNRALAKLAVTLGKTVPAARIAAYFDALSDVALPRVLAAVDLATKQADRFPTPGRLRQLAAAEAAKSPAPMPGLQAAPMDVPTDVLAWCKASGIDCTREDIPASFESYRHEAASCGRRESCQTGECVEQVPVPQWTYVYNPPRLIVKYRWCQHHDARCAQRAERRVQREQTQRGERSAS